MKKIGSITPTTTRLLMSCSVTTMSWWYCTGVEISKLLMSPEKRLTAAQQMGSGQTTHTDENVGSCGLTDSADGSHVEERDGSVQEVGEHEVVHLPARAEPDQLSPDVAQPGEDKGRDPKDCYA